MKLALGSAQFGLRYGIANTAGQVSRATIGDILEHARRGKMDTIDTAIAYGDSEQRLGEAGVSEWRIVSKLPALPNLCSDVDKWVNGQLQESLTRLRLKKLTGLLLHRPAQLLEPNGQSLWNALMYLRRAGIIEKIGFSIYDPDELESLWSMYRPQIVQAPYNIFDRRLANSGWLDRLHEANVEIHVRSIFLQGLLLMPPHTRPKQFGRWSGLLSSFDDWRKTQQVSALRACLGFVVANPRISRAVVGVDSLKQLNEILVEAALPIVSVPEHFDCRDVDLINPSRWDSL